MLKKQRKINRWILPPLSPITMVIDAFFTSQCFFDSVDDCFICSCEQSSTSSEEEMTFVFELQSDDITPVIGEDAAADEVTNTDVLVFKDTNSGVTLDYSPIDDTSFFSEYSSKTELGDFLSRPVLIDTFNWTEGAPLGPREIQPWDLFFNDLRVKKKIDNYFLLNCNLHIKVIINASPFYYGRGIVSYRPLSSSVIGLNSGFSPGEGVTANEDNYLMQLSQLPHIDIYPQSNQGGEMTLPFLSYKNWLNLRIRQEFIDHGALRFSSFGDLLNANSVVGVGVSVCTYAWATDVKLSTPTSGLALQSADEYVGDGIISTPASAVANFTEALGDVPIIGKYMTATSVIASGIGKLASWFGFSNPPVINDVLPFKDVPFHAFSNSEISTPVEKLSLDPKNELSIDPRIVGLEPDDDMSIATVASRESYLYGTNWNLSDAEDTILFSTNIFPELIQYANVAGRDLRMATPLAHVGQMFQNWRGDIVIRLQFLCSKYHRGRVRVTYDPYGDIVTNTDTSNVAFTRIVDITEESEVEIVIPYMQTVPWLTNPNSNGAQYYGGAAYPYLKYAADNGFLTVRVFTVATAPVAIAPIRMLVSVRGGDNLEFANPRELNQDLSYLQVQSQDITLSSISNDASTTMDPNRYLINFGEKITSFRQLLRRTVLSRVTATDVPGAVRVYKTQWHLPRTPMYPGFDLNGIDDATGHHSGIPEKYNFVKETPYTYLAPCYLGRRGSMRWHFNTDSADTFGSISIKRSLETRTHPKLTTFGTLALATSKSQLASFYTTTTESGAIGQSLINQNTQTGLSVEIPQYSSVRMQTTNPFYNNLGAVIDDTTQDTMLVELITKPGSYATDPMEGTDVHMYSSIGTDFSLLKFLCVPIREFYASPPPL